MKKEIIIIFFLILQSSAMAQYYRYESEFSAIQIVSIDGKYKLYDNKKQKFLSPITYDYICPYGYIYTGSGTSVYVVRSDKKYGLVDIKTGKEVLSPSVSPISCFEEKPYLPTENTLEWIINDKKEQLLSFPLYMSNLSHSRKVSPFVFCYKIDPQSYTCSSYKIGYCEASTGKMVVPPIFDNVESFIDKKHELVTCGNLKGLVDFNGKQIIECKYNSILNFDNEVVKVTVNTGDKTLHGLINKKGKEVLPIIYHYIGHSYSNTYKVYLDNKVGLVSDENKTIVPIIYDDVIQSYDSEIIFIINNNKWGMVDSSNRMLIKPLHYQNIFLEKDKEGNTYFYGALNGKWGVMNRNGKILLQPQYNQITLCLEKQGHFVVLKNEEWLQIDDKGNITDRYEKNPYEIEDIIVPHL